MEVQLNILNEESNKVGLKIHRGQTKFMTNFVTTQKIEIEGIEIEKVEQYKYLGQTIALEDRTANEAQQRMYYPNNDLRLSNMVTYKRHS